MKKDKIFVQIAAYRDPELKNTLESLITNAKNPENLVICIAWQYGDNDDFEASIRDYHGDERSTFKIIEIPYKESKGACWARHQIQRRYDNEEFTFQLDSHHRFIPNWDVELKEMYNDLKNYGFEKPLITAYIPSYQPNNDPEGRVNVPWKMNFDRFTPEGVVFFMPASIDEYKTLNKPVRARFYSAHFAFTTGEFCNEVQHNPDYYFHGEEISIAVRAYTHGYDLFHPHKIIAWHEYTREGRTKHWNDIPTWKETDTNSLKINRELFGMDGEEMVDFGKYGFGTKRTLEDYEKYAGLRFSTRSVQQETLNNTYPPNKKYTNGYDYEDSFVRVFKHCIDLYKDHIKENVDYGFIAVIIEDADKTSLYRKDLLKNDIQSLLNTRRNENKQFDNIWVEFNTITQPKRWIVWPYINGVGWGEKIEGNIG